MKFILSRKQARRQKEDTLPIKQAGAKGLDLIKNKLKQSRERLCAAQQEESKPLLVYLHT